jgi:bifunctional non-homologous end joining protein LigD
MLMRSPLAAKRLSPPGFIRPCQPTLSTTIPTGPEWTHEVKYDGYRLIARKDGSRVHLWSGNGRNWTDGFPAIAAGVQRLPADVVLDGEAVAPCPRGFPDFHALSTSDGTKRACLLVFDLLFLDGVDLRLRPLSERRGRLLAVLKDGPGSLRLSEHMEGPEGSVMFEHAARMGLEGIVSKRKDSLYRSGRTTKWLKIKAQAYRRHTGAKPSSALAPGYRCCPAARA